MLRLSHTLLSHNLDMKKIKSNKAVKRSQWEECEGQR